MKEKIITRRDFLRVAAGATMASYFGIRDPGGSQGRTNGESRPHPEC